MNCIQARLRTSFGLCTDSWLKRLDTEAGFSSLLLSFPFSRLVEYTRADGTVGRRVKPYIIDLGSGNGTFLNNKRIEPQRYYELKEKDVLKFGFSSREYVLLHESSDTSELDRKDDEDDYEEEVVSDS